MNEVVLGEGVLSWPANERRTDRYGLVGIYKDGTMGEEEKNYLLLPAQAGKGTLVALVVDGRKSGHIGDLFRQIYQTRVPQAGERFELGDGEFFMNGVWVGVRPEDHREVDWMDPRQLYEVHRSKVQLLWIPAA